MVRCQAGNAFPADSPAGFSPPRFPAVFRCPPLFRRRLIPPPALLLRPSCSSVSLFLCPLFLPRHVSCRGPLGAGAGEAAGFRGRRERGAGDCWKAARGNGSAAGRAGSAGRWKAAGKRDAVGQSGSGPFEGGGKTELPGTTRKKAGRRGTAREEKTAGPLLRRPAV